MSNKFYFHTPEAKERFLDVMRERTRGRGLVVGQEMFDGKGECAVAAVVGFGCTAHLRVPNYNEFENQIGYSTSLEHVGTALVFVENDDFVGTPQERAYHMYLWGSKQPVRGEESS